MNFQHTSKEFNFEIIPKAMYRLKVWKLKSIFKFNNIIFDVLTSLRDESVTRLLEFIS